MNAKCPIAVLVLLLLCGSLVPAAQAQTRQLPARAEPPLRAVRSVPQPTLSTAAIGDVPYDMPQALRIGVAARPAAGKPRKAEKHDLPLRGEDLRSGERYYIGKKIHSDSGSQMWGYDIGAMKKNSGKDTWSEVRAGTDWKDPKNGDYYVYGKPVYAVRGGRVIRCWRNAPENPRPFSSTLGDSSDQPFAERAWLHAAWRADRMSGGGNHLLIEEDDGERVLYAHAQPGSIPSALCPHNATLYSKPGAKSEADVAPADQATVNAGDRLFVIGNSGNSSAPHLHIHKQDAGATPVQMQFRRGLSSPFDKDDRSADIDHWDRFAGQRIPDGPVLVWPPRSLVPEYARHGYNAGTFQRLFEHLADSGFALAWIDAYSVGGRSYLNFMWRPSNGAWRAYYLLSASAYQSRFNDAAGDGFEPIHVESSVDKGDARYSMIFAKNVPGGAIARHGLTYQQHMQVMDEAKGKGMHPVNVSVVSTGGDLRYTVLYRSGKVGGWVVKSQIPVSGYQAEYSKQAQAGRHPAHVAAYMHKGDAYYAVVFTDLPDGARRDRHGLTGQQYQTEYTDARKDGLLTHAVSGYDGAKKNHRYIAVWRK